MKRAQLSFVLCCFLVLVICRNGFSFNSSTSFGIVADTTVYEVNGGYSHVNWTGYKIGGTHTGKIAVSNGQLNFVDSLLVGGQFTIDMNSITNTDIENEEMAAKLVTHLKSSDFFDVEQHKTATFKIEKILPYGKVGDNQRKYKIVGKLTLKGITKELKFNADIYEYETSISASARITLDRSEFDVKYGSGTFFASIGDKIIYDEVLLDVSLSASKN